MKIIQNSIQKTIEARKRAQSLSKAKAIKLKQGLEMVAKESGFNTWKEYKDSMDTFWYSKASPFLTQWFKSHSEAKEYLSQNGGYLLTFKGDYFIACADYIRFLGLDPDMDLWARVGFDLSSSQSLDKFYHQIKAINKV